MIRVLEQFAAGKTNDKGLCEDDIIEGENVIAIVDGATAISNRLFQNGDSQKVCWSIRKSDKSDYERIDGAKSGLWDSEYATYSYGNG